MVGADIIHCTEMYHGLATDGRAIFAHSKAERLTPENGKEIEKFSRGGAKLAEEEVKSSISH